MKTLQFFFILTLISCFTFSCKHSYVAMGVSYDRGLVGRTDWNGEKEEGSGRGPVIEIGKGIDEKNMFSFTTGILGYTDVYDGDPSGFWTLEYARYFNYRKFGAFVGSGIGKNGRYAGGAIIPFRAGVKVDIPLGERLGIRLSILNRYNHYLDEHGYNNGFTLMGGLSF